MPLPNKTNVRLSFRRYLLDEMRDTILESHISVANRRYAPGDEFYIRETLATIDENNRALQLYEMRGRVTYDVMSAIGKGTEFAEDLQTRIGDAFEKKRSLTTVPDFAVGLERIERPDGRAFDEFWWMASVSIYWRTYSVATVNKTI